MPSRSLQRLKFLAAAIAVVGLTVTACGSSTTASSSSSPSTSTNSVSEAAAESSAASSGSSAAGSAAAGSTGKAAAQAYLDDAVAAATFTSPGPAIDISALQGKTISAVTLDFSVPFVQAVLKGMQEAGEAAGVTVDVFDAKGSSATASQGIEQAVASGSAAVVAFGVNFDQVAGAVATATDAGVPVIGALNIDSNAELETGSAGSVSIDYYASGKLLAANAIATTDGPVHAAFQNLPSIDTFTAMRQGVEDGFAEYCPDECTLQVDDLTQSDFKKNAETLTAAEISGIPDLNWILTAIDGIAQFTIPAVELSGEDVSVGSINAVTANLEFIQDGRVQKVDVGNNNSWLGWGMLDRALRAATGAEPEMSVVPIKLFNAENLTGLDVSNEDALFDDVDYRADYLALWTK